ncbi:MAG: NAD-dependent dehydratase [Agromyces sp.]|nr:NAD-dependent dehydratase [Agromyces sp.]
MRILLTGGTGYIGSAVLDRLVGAGHHIVAAVRNEEAAAAVAARGAHPAVGDLTDAAWLAAALADVDAAIHTAAPAGGAAEFNASVIDTVIETFAGTGRRFVLTSGVWIYGSGTDIRDDDRPDPAELVAWKVPQEDRLLASDVAATIVTPGVVYGHGHGVLGLITEAPRAVDDALTLIGDGEQHWTWVHADDLARLYQLAVEHPEPLGRLIGSDGSPTTVRAIAETVAGPAGAVAESADATRARFGDAFAEALLLDASAFGEKARSLGWVPEHTSVLDEVRAVRAAAA